VEHTKIGAKIDKITEIDISQWIILQNFQLFNVTFIPTDYNHKNGIH
jgi:hypothetical protein